MGLPKGGKKKIWNHRYIYMGDDIKTGRCSYASQESPGGNLPSQPWEGIKPLTPDIKLPASRTVRQEICVV